MALDLTKFKMQLIQHTLCVPRQRINKANYVSLLKFYKTMLLNLSMCNMLIYYIVYEYLCPIYSRDM